jgi:hypothetical protein
MQPTKQPEKKIRAGGLSATIWKNEQEKNGKSYSFYSVTLDRSYTDETGNWKTSHNLRSNDLPKATLVLDKAFEYLTLKETA